MDIYVEIVNNLLIKANCFSVEDFATASGLTASSARVKLFGLEIKGKINQIGRRYYSVEKTVSPTQFWAVARALTLVHSGCFTTRQFAEAIGIDARFAATQLRRMIAEGQVERVSTTKYAYTPIKNLKQEGSLL